MVRASALILLSSYGLEAVQWAAEDALEDPEELVRVAAVRSLQDLERTELARLLMPKLLDPVRAVRVEAARILSVLPPSAFDPPQQAAFDRAGQSSWPPSTPWQSRPPPTSRMGIIDTQSPARPAGRRGAADGSGGRPLRGVGADRNRAEIFQDAEEEYQTALRINAGCIPARVNLAMLLNEQGRNAEAEKQFRKVIGLARRSPRSTTRWDCCLAEDESGWTKWPRSSARLPR